MEQLLPNCLFKSHIPIRHDKVLYIQIYTYMYHKMLMIIAQSNYNAAVSHAFLETCL